MQLQQIQLNAPPCRLTQSFKRQCLIYDLDPKPSPRLPMGFKVFGRFKYCHTENLAWRAFSSVLPYSDIALNELLPLPTPTSAAHQQTTTSFFNF